MFFFIGLGGGWLRNVQALVVELGGKLLQMMLSADDRSHLQCPVDGFCHGNLCRCLELAVRALLANSKHQLQHMLRVLEDFCDCYSLEVNVP